MARSRTSPVSTTFDLLGRRWSLRILWELREGPKNFRALREACDDLSPSSLSQRLADLREFGVIEPSEDGYRLNDAGRELSAILTSIEAWSGAHLGRRRRGGRKNS